MPRPLIVASVIALVLLILSLLRLRISVRVHEGFSLRITLCGIPLVQYPKRVWWRRFSPRAARAYERRCDRKWEKKMAKKAAHHHENERPKVPLADKGRTLLDKLRTLRAALAFLLRKTRKHVKLRVARLHVRVASQDAATTAVLYGTVMALLCPLLSLLSRITRLQARAPDVSVTPDFLGERWDVDLHLELSVTLARLLALGSTLALFYLTALRPRKPRKTRASKAAEPQSSAPDNQ